MDDLYGPLSSDALSEPVTTPFECEPLVDTGSSAEIHRARMVPRLTGHADESGQETPGWPLGRTNQPQR
jgi:hypothetical protein